MKRETLANLIHLAEADWFCAVGDRSGISDSAVVVSSWAEALSYAESLAWQNTKLEVCNRLRETVLAASRARFLQWNELVDAVKERTVPLVEQKTRRVIASYSLPAGFQAAVNWDILGVCMESEYVDISPPGFYSGMAYWYAQGHFPCGWSRGNGTGRPVIY